MHQLFVFVSLYGVWGVFCVMLCHKGCVGFPWYCSSLSFPTAVDLLVWSFRHSSESVCPYITQTHTYFLYRLYTSIGKNHKLDPTVAKGVDRERERERDCDSLSLRDGTTHTPHTHIIYSCFYSSSIPGTAQ